MSGDFFPCIHISTFLTYVTLICQQAKIAEAKEKREAKAEAKKKEGSLEKTEKVRTSRTEQTKY